MKKIILLLALPLVTLMAVEFTMTPSGLFAKTTTQPSIPTSTPSTVSEIKNSYLEPVNLPECDASNPEVQFIKSNADWSTINSTSKRIFCVSPGDYRTLGNIKITRSGTSGKRRYLILNNGNDTHPGKLNQNELANYNLSFIGASYWTVDRMASIENGLTSCVELLNGSSNIIFNRMYTDEVGTVVKLTYDDTYLGTNNITVQKSRFNGMRETARKHDTTAIWYIGSGVPAYLIKNLKVISNEFRNQNDSIQPGRHMYGDAKQGASAEGLIIDDNDFYLDNTIYTDGHGNYTPTGAYSFSENAIDLKAGSKNPSNPVIITNNRIWGYRNSDKTNSSCDDPGYAIVTHFNIPNTIIEDNIIFDSAGGIYAGDKRNFDYVMENCSIKRNIIKDVGYIPPASPDGIPLRGAYSLSITESRTTEVSENTIIDPRLAYAGQSAPTYYYSRFVYAENVNFINNVVNGNTDPLETRSVTGGDYITGNGPSPEYTEDYTFTTDKYTNNPRVITVENVVKPN